MNSMLARACFILFLLVWVIDAAALAPMSDEEDSVGNSADVDDADKRIAKRWGLYVA
jgi:hypothetical protein